MEGVIMSRFYAEIKGNRGKASRLGFKESGMWSHTRGWNRGVEVRCYVDSDDNDCIDVYVTGGSTGAKSKKLMAVVTDDKVEYMPQPYRRFITDGEELF